MEHTTTHRTHRDHRKKPFTILLAIILVLTLVLGTGCATYDRFRASLAQTESEVNEVVRIGVYEPLSGVDEKAASLEILGIELAHQQMPEILGKPIELVYMDNGSDPEKAQTAAKELVNQKVSVVLGSYGSTLSIAGGQVFRDAKLPAIAITSTNPLVTAANDYYVRVCFVDSFQAIAMAKYAVETLSASNTAVIANEDDDYSITLSKVFREKVASLQGIDPDSVSAYEYSKNNSNLGTILDAMKEAAPQVIYLPVAYEDAAKIINQARSKGIKATFLGVEEWEQQEFLAKGGPAVAGVVFPSFFDSTTMLTPATQQLVDAYYQQFESWEVPSEVAHGFDAYLLAVDAIRRAETSVNTEAIHKAIADTKAFQGATGEITLFGTRGDPIKSVVIKTVTDGAFAYLSTAVPVWK